MEAANQRTPEKVSRAKDSQRSLEMPELPKKETVPIPEAQDRKGDADLLLNDNNNQTFAVDVWLIGALVVALLVLGFSLFFFLRAAQMPNEVESVLIPQPFTENNDLMFFHLPNGLRVMIVKPNTQQNNTFICELTSNDPGRRFRVRPS